MDIFKLLSRSTTLRPSDQKTGTGAARLPSEGTAVRPQAISRPGPSQSNKKRKRGRDVADQWPSPSVTGTAEATQDDAGGEMEVDGDAEVSSQDLEYIEDMCLEDCQRLLNQHKLKATWLNRRTPRSEASSNGVRKSKPAKDSRLLRIFPRPLTSFQDLRRRYDISRRLAENIESQGFVTPTEVQIGSLPILLAGTRDSGLPAVERSSSSGTAHVDLLSVAPTGSGKTLAFLIPLIQEMLKIRHEQSNAQDCVKGIVLAPTHELVDQIVIEGKKLMTGTGVRIAAMQKGAHVYQQEDEDPDLQKTKTIIKTDVLVGTPLMILNSIRDEDVSRSLSSVQHLVLDEADVLLDPMFREQTTDIWTACDHADLRVSLWSATMGSSIENLAQDFIIQRRQTLGLSLDNHYIIRIIVGLKDSSLPSIEHRLIYAGTEQGKLLGLRELLHPSTSLSDTFQTALRPPFLVFTQTVERARALHSELLYDIPLEAGGTSRIASLHSDLTDHVRSEVMTRFRRGEVWIIITTDLLSRGIDFRGVNGIVNYDIPTTAASYVHRAGRTGRAGREGGVAVTLYTKEDIPYVKNIANVIAATEKVHGKQQQTSQGLQRWLLDSLPKVSRDTKMELKTRGVAARRTLAPGAKRSKEARRARISTKSGYDRQVQNRKKGAIEKSRKIAKAVDGGGDDDEEWAGFDE